MKKSSTMSEIIYNLVDDLLTKSENFDQYYQIFRERRIHDKVMKLISDASLKFSAMTLAASSFCVTRYYFCQGQTTRVKKMLVQTALKARLIQHNSLVS